MLEKKIYDVYKQSKKAPYVEYNPEKIKNEKANSILNLFKPAFGSAVDDKFTSLLN